MLLQTVVSFGQTKEETIEWLKEKFVKHGKEATVEVLNISPCEVYLKRTFYNAGYESVKFDPSATEWRMMDWERVVKLCQQHREKLLNIDMFKMVKKKPSIAEGINLQKTVFPILKSVLPKPSTI